MNTRLAAHLLLPLIQQAYVRVFEASKGENVEKWSYIGKAEFGDCAPFHLPDEATLIQEIHAEEPSFFWGKSSATKYPFGLLVETDRHVVIAFRGTVGYMEWINNGLVLQRQLEIPGIEFPLKVHSGFLEIFKSIQTHLDQYWNTIDTLRQDKPLIITGHSLGGAIAQLSALYLRMLEPTVYTFGAPRVGDPEFVKAYNNSIKHSFRVVNGYDWVPSLPPKLVLEKGKELYKHTRGEVNVYSTDKKLEDWKMIADPEVTGAHMPSAYLKALQFKIDHKGF
ncbi:MAG: hypothetical protein CL843_15740 [Crocinitomicaceae bacterium]|nr:hypothetical protein [Crocinitomicaceae bacterium]|tara:strand:- start:2527 stop:3366 length:840 start_codon:yes stop_codon:yes gene_type:complete